MISCCWRCLSSLYFACSFFSSGATAAIARIDLNCLTVSGAIAARTMTVSSTIDMPQPTPSVSWMKTRIGFSTSTISCTGAMRASVVIRSARARTQGEQALGFDGVVAPVAEGVAPQDAPRRQHQPAKYAELLQRGDGVGRARGLVLAAPRQRG